MSVIAQALRQSLSSRFTTLTPTSATSRTPPQLDPPSCSCQDDFYLDSHSLTCLTCSNGAQTAAPLIVLGSIISLGGGVVAYIYKFRYDAINAYYEERKGQLFILINQGTMVVSGMATTL